jgi:hypothetical protein
MQKHEFLAIIDINTLKEQKNQDFSLGNTSSNPRIVSYLDEKFQDPEINTGRMSGYLLLRRFG